MVFLNCVLITIKILNPEEIKKKKTLRTYGYKKYISQLQVLSVFPLLRRVTTWFTG